MRSPGARLPALVLLAAVSLQGAAAFAQGPEPLSAGSAFERAFASGETHRYGIRLGRGAYARVTLDQQGVDAVVSASSPGGSLLTEADSPRGRFGPETVSIVAEDEGVYSLEVRALDAWQAPGSYRLEVLEVRAALPGDVRRVEAERLRERAYQRASLGMPEDLAAAVASYEKALLIAQELGGPVLESEVRYGLGQAQARLGRPQAAMDHYERALALQHRAQDGAGAMLTLNQIGRLHRGASRSAEALSAFVAALSLCERFGHPEQAAPILNNIGVLHHQSGRLGEALESYARSLELFRQAGDLPGEANVLGSLGSVYSTLGRAGEARETFERALALARTLKRRDLEANALNNLGDSFQASGQFRKALDSFAAALALFRETGDTARQAAALNNMGGLLTDLGAPAEGRGLLLQALSLRGEPRSGARVRTNLFRAERALGRPEEALKWLEEAGGFYRESGDRLGEAQTLVFLGSLQLETSRFREAEGLLGKALSIFREVKDRFWQAVTLRVLGRVQESLGASPAARASFAEALRIAGELGEDREQARILQERARASLQRGELEGARQDLEAALAKSESLRAEVSGERLRATFLASVSDVYGLSVETLLRLHEARPGKGFEAQALQASERSRGRALLDFLARSEVEVREGDPGLRAEEMRLRQELAARAARRMELLRSEEKTGEVAEVEKAIESLVVEHRLAEARLRSGDPRYAALREPGIDIAGIQGLLDEDTALLEYFLGEARSWLWVVTPSSLAVFELPGQERIEALARRVHEHLRAPGAGGVARRAGLEELSHLLLGPALEGLAGKRLAFVADGALRALPFAALPVPAEGGGTVPLIVRHEVVNLPSAAVLREIRRAAAGRSPSTGDLAILADPVYEASDARVRTARKPGLEVQLARADARPGVPEAEALRSFHERSRNEPLVRLSWSRREAQGIAAAARGRDVLLALDFRASRELALSAELARYRVLHFATHGFLDEEHPELSGLAFSQWDEQGRRLDGFLRLQDVYGLDLRAGLVVLSGCETALGQRLRGEGLLGLSHGFLHAGASQVLASLWKIRDRATAELMERFYRAIYQEGLRPAAALRRAQVEMWSQRSWRDPYYWAAFTLQGDWRVSLP